MASAFSTVAYNGWQVKPRLVQQVGTDVYDDGGEAPRHPRQGGASGARHAAAGRRGGDGRGGQIPGYDVAGKTGTAEIALEDGSGYAKDIYTSSFIGMVPADHPRLVVLVTVESTPMYGAQAAAPAFKEIMLRPAAPGDRAVNSRRRRTVERGSGGPALRPSGGLVESAAMKLSELVQGVSGATVRGDPGTEIRGLAYHTRDVVDGTLFFCIPGSAHDGHAFAAAAVAAGAAALVCERDTGEPVPHVIVPAVRRAMALTAARWYGRPSAGLRVVGVTGTNGKTTTAHLVAGVFAAAGLPCGLLGTVVNRIGGVENPVKLTTAESLDLQRMFAEMVAAGDKACALEVSSHALAQDRAAGIDFDASCSAISRAISSTTTRTYGGTAAAPAAREIMQFSLQHLEIAP